MCVALFVAAQDRGPCNQMRVRLGQQGVSAWPRSLVKCQSDLPVAAVDKGVRGDQERGLQVALERFS